MPVAASRLPTLPAERLCLRWIEEDDASALFEVFSDPQVTRYWSTPAWKERTDALRLIEEVRACFVRDELLQWGITRLADDRLIGTCTLAHLDRTHRRAELGFALGSSHWGHGLAREAITRLLTFAFEELELHRIEADVDPRNTKSIALLERLGFRREGHLRERWHVNGEICDALLYGLLRTEWLTTHDDGVA
jgi:[ribosomal protein S5]-alanine N-acetyltransferase